MGESEAGILESEMIPILDSVPQTMAINLFTNSRYLWQSILGPSEVLSWNITFLEVYHQTGCHGEDEMDLGCEFNDARSWPNPVKVRYQGAGVTSGIFFFLPKGLGDKDLRRIAGHKIAQFFWNVAKMNLLR